ncbi:MAG: delta-60 repeat domain-containing protein [Flavobacteriales bacterium]|nr:delta-60 repeat domain-containing protein [Flavobacteriales bacterium]
MRRMTPGGLIHHSSLNASPYFYSLTRRLHTHGAVLASGQHLLSDSTRGFVGFYDLIWFSNTGYLDTTKVHRQSNGIMWEFKELPDGKFICSCSARSTKGSQWTRCSGVPDGTLDTTFHTGINMGNIYAYHPLPDGRVLLGGSFRRAADPNQLLQLVRLLPDGSLDPTFENFHQCDIGILDGTPQVQRIEPWQADKYFVMGLYRGVDGDERGGICVIDTTGALLPLMDECLNGPFTYQGLTAASIHGILPTPDSSGFYLWGSYTGYDDGTVNDTLQRFVSRLLVRS